MAQQARQTVPAEIEALKNRLDVYRKQRQRPRCLPENLWMQAAELARQYGVCRVQRLLRLNYYDLLQRVEALPAMSVEAVPAIPKNTTPAFVELKVPHTSLANVATILELEDRTGKKLTVRLAGDNGVALVELVRTLWNNGPCSN
jgi:hypothetical protein